MNAAGAAVAATVATIAAGLAIRRPRKGANHKPLDAWTTVHVASGVAAGALELPRGATMAAMVGYEVVEQLVERTEAGRRVFRTTRPESLANVLVDVAVFGGGYELGRRL